MRTRRRLSTSVGLKHMERVCVCTVFDTHESLMRLVTFATPSPGMTLEKNKLLDDEVLKNREMAHLFLEEKIMLSKGFILSTPRCN